MSAVLRHWLANGVIAYRRHQACGTLSKLNDSLLRDIGLDRAAIEAHVHDRLPWHSFERAPTPGLQPSIQGCG